MYNSLTEKVVAMNERRAAVVLELTGVDSSSIRSDLTSSVDTPVARRNESL